MSYRCFAHLIAAGSALLVAGASGAEKADRTRPVTLDNTAGTVLYPSWIESTNTQLRYYFTLDNTRSVPVTAMSNGANAQQRDRLRPAGRVVHRRHAGGPRPDRG